jgi:nuclear transcription factor Y gamma
MDKPFESAFPLARIKKIIKADEDAANVSAESVKLIAIATEKFLALFAKACHQETLANRRKTVTKQDLQTIVERSPLFAFLSDFFVEQEAS